ncbi:MAG: DUF4111 domain-containing protein [Clostridia bacterium]|nr:DUF4111 domain-containing protein [Clostridia bacterium]
MERADRLIAQFCEACRAAFGANLVGVYLHGSAAMGCFQPEKSDIDLLVVVRDEPTDAQKRMFMDEVVLLNEEAPEKGIEMSVMQAAALRPFVHPAPYVLHFSPAHLDWYRRDPVDYVDKMKGLDPDLAAHCTIILHRGRAVCGQSIPEVFDPVRHEDYLDSILQDVAGAAEEIAGCPVYMILNLCRVLAYAQEGLILSKREGGEWGCAHLPQHAGLIAAAMEEYRTGVPAQIDLRQAEAFAQKMLRQIGEEGT